MKWWCMMIWPIKTTDSILEPVSIIGPLTDINYMIFALVSLIKISPDLY